MGCGPDDLILFVQSFEKTMRRSSGPDPLPDEILAAAHHPKFPLFSTYNSENNKKPF